MNEYLPTVRACGCVPYMYTRHREVLVLVVRNICGSPHWEFPKGKQEAGESDKETALRELHEETGLTGQLQDDVLVPIEYTFERDKVVCHKTAQFFLCKVPDGSYVVLQEQELDAYAWLPLEELEAQMTYESMKKVAKEVCGLLGD